MTPPRQGDPPPVPGHRHSTGLRHRRQTRSPPGRHDQGLGGQRAVGRPSHGARPRRASGSERGRWPGAGTRASGSDAGAGQGDREARAPGVGAGDGEAPGLGRRARAMVGRRDSGVGRGRWWGVGTRVSGAGDGGASGLGCRAPGGRGAGASRRLARRRAVGSGPGQALGVGRSPVPGRGRWWGRPARGAGDCGVAGGVEARTAAGRRDSCVGLRDAVARALAGRRRGAGRSGRGRDRRWGSGARRCRASGVGGGVGGRAMVGRRAGDVGRWVRVMVGVGARTRATVRLRAGWVGPGHGLGKGSSATRWYQGAGSS
jgi:hypothetical protein